jgi:hypothetical protein
MDLSPTFYRRGPDESRKTSVWKLTDAVAARGLVGGLVDARALGRPAAN